MSDELMLDVGQANEIKLAMRKFGWTNADIKKLCEGDNFGKILAFIRGWDKIKQCIFWTEKDGIIYFSVISDGTNGEEWITRLENKKHRVSDYTKSILLSKDFKPTNGVITQIAIIKCELLTYGNRITENIRKFAHGKRFFEPNVEVSCLIREMFTDKELEAMGLTWIAIMHKPIKDSDDILRLFRVSRDGLGSWLRTCYGDPLSRWDLGYGFAFAVLQV